MPRSSTRRKDAIKHEQSSGNVFSDVGLPEDYQAKADLVATIDQIISERELTQTEAAALLGIDQPRVSAMLRGKLDLFSLDKLISFVSRLGNAVEIRISKRQSEGSGLKVVSALSNWSNEPPLTLPLGWSLQICQSQRSATEHVCYMQNVYEHANALLGGTFIQTAFFHPLRSYGFLQSGTTAGLMPPDVIRRDCAETR